MCFLTPHNIADKLSLEQIANGPRDLSIMLNFWEHAMEKATRKQRNFLAAWGAMGQRNGAWGFDIGNVTYATVWHHLLSDNDVDLWRRCRSVTSLVTSGNMIELAFGVMFLDERNLQTFEEFEELARRHKMDYDRSRLHSTYTLLRQYGHYWHEVKLYRDALESYVRGWHGLLFEAKSDWKAIFARYQNNKTWRPNAILNAHEVMRLGHETQRLNEFLARPLPPPSKWVVDAEELLTRWQ